MARAINAISMKMNNRNLVLDTIRRTPVSRADIALMLGFTRASVTGIIDSLLKEGLIKEGETKENGFGRPSTLLYLNPNARHFIGINIKRSGSMVGIVDFCGSILSQETISPLYKTKADLIEALSESIIHQLQQSDFDRITSIGICTPGPVSYREGTILNPPNFSLIHELNIVEPLSKRFNLNTYLDNVSNCMALEESFYGRAKDALNVMVIQVNEGIGSGFLFEDKLYRGKNGMGPEIGHVSIKYDGKTCSCGNSGCVETYASIPNILADTPYNSFREIPPDSMYIVHQEADYLACAITTAYNMFDLSQIFISGDFEPYTDVLLEDINALVGRRRLLQGSSLPQIVKSNLVSSCRTGAMPAVYNYFHK